MNPVIRLNWHLLRPHMPFKVYISIWLIHLWINIVIKFTVKTKLFHVYLFEGNYCPLTCPFPTCGLFLVKVIISWQRERVLFHRLHHVVPPCFDSSPEQAKNWLKRGAFFVVEDEMRSVQLVAICIHTSRCH